MSGRAFRAARIACLVLLLPAVSGTAQSSSVPPARTATAASPATVTNAVPAGPRQSDQRSATDLLETVNGATDLIYRGALAASPKDAVDIKMARQGGALFEHAGNALTVGAIGAEVARGNVGNAARKTVAAGIDRCIDHAITAFCAAVSAPTAEAGLLPCTVAVQAAKFCVETYYDKSAGEWAVEQGEAGYDAVKTFFLEKNAEQVAARQDQQASFSAIQSSNESGAMAIADSQAYAGPPEDDGSAALTNALMAGVLSAAAQRPSLPPPAASSAASPAPSGACHPGHDETSHPGGCHSAPLGAQ